MASPAADEIVRDCLAVRVRLIGRAVTGIYDQALERHGVSIAQVNLLAALGKVGRCAPGQLGDILQLERSTISRNLSLLLKQDWIEAVSADGKGLREVALTAEGRRKLNAVLPDWRLAQQEAEGLLGAKATTAVRGLARNLASLPDD